MIEQRLKEANGRLRANNYKVSIEHTGQQLYLRAMLPSKPDSNQNGFSRQRIRIASANSEGVQIAEKAAKTLRFKLDNNLFNWSDYIDIDQPSQPKTIGEWLTEFEADYFQRRAKNFKSESTWKVDYMTVFRTLDPSVILTADVLKEAILTTQPDTRTRKRYFLALKVLADFANIDADFSLYAGSYNFKKRVPRQLPTDELIVEWYQKISDTKWKWVFGMLATYGLRNHEVFLLDFSRLKSGDNMLVVLEGKTGYRTVWPFHPEWFDQFGLKEVLIPNINLNRSNSAIGGTVSQRFRRNDKLPFKVYDLRHCWAVRTLEYGLDVSLAAQQMGHSLSVHSNLYHSWINAQHHQRAFDLAISKADRPQPPKI